MVQLSEFPPRKRWGPRGCSASGRNESGRQTEDGPWDAVVGGMKGVSRRWEDWAWYGFNTRNGERVI